MDTFSKEIPIGVIEFTEDWPMLCVADDARVIFFKTIKARALSTYVGTIVKVTRNKQEYSSGIFYVTGGHVETDTYNGLKEIIPEKLNFPEESLGLQSYWFKKGDQILVKSDNWIEENPVNSIVTSRKIGTPFSKVFASDPELAEYIAEILGVSASSLQNKTVIFETTTGSKKFNEFF